MILPPRWPSLPCDVQDTVQVAQAHDLVELAALKRRVEQRCYGGLVTAAALQHRHRRVSTAWHLMTLLADGELLLVARSDDEIVGLAAARAEREHGADVLHLHSTYVDRPGTGAGRALLRARLVCGRSLGISLVTAHTVDGVTGPGRRLERLGMVRTAGPGLGGGEPSPTLPGTTRSRWWGSVDVALARLEATPAGRS